MNKLFIIGVIFLVLLVPACTIFAVGAPGSSHGTEVNSTTGDATGGAGPNSSGGGGSGGIVTCKGPADCDLTMFFAMLAQIYDKIIEIATPLAIIAVIIGAILMMISAGNPNLMGLGKKIFWSAIIGLVLVFCSYLIIDTIIKAVAPGMNNWANPF